MKTFEEMAEELKPGHEVWIRLYAPTDIRPGVVTVDKWSRERGKMLIEYRDKTMTAAEKLDAALQAARGEVNGG